MWRRSRRKKVSVDYYADGLGVKNHNISVLSEPRFANAWAYTSEQNNSAWPGGTPDVRWRAHTACWAASHCAKLDGDFVECGVYMGLLSLTICGFLDWSNLDKNFWLFDTFEGLPDDNDDPDIAKINSHYTATFDDATRAFSKFSNIELVKGILPDSLTAMPKNKPIAYLSMDLNHAGAEMAVMDQLWSRLVKSAIVIADDYGWAGNEPQYEAWNAFAAEKNVPILSMPTGQGIIIKP